jgi:hypothetical protein
MICHAPEILDEFQIFIQTKVQSAAPPRPGRDQSLLDRDAPKVKVKRTG